MKSKFMALAAIAAATVSASAQNVQITEILYTGLHGEFVEITNVDEEDAADLEGWKFSDDRRGTTVGTNAIDLSQIDTLSPGESAIITEVSDAVFILAWYTEPAAAPGGSKLPLGFTPLTAGNIVENNWINLGRTDEVNIYDNTNTLVDRVIYSDNSGNPADIGPRSEDVSAKPDSSLTGAGLNATFSTWKLSGASNVPNGFAWKSGEYSSTHPAPRIPGSIGSPGKYPND